MNTPGSPPFAPPALDAFQLEAQGFVEDGAGQLGEITQREESWRGDHTKVTQRKQITIDGDANAI